MSHEISSVFIVMILLTALIQNKAVLLFSQDTVFQITFGVSVPIRMSRRGNLVFSSGYQFNYALPRNVSKFKSTIVRQSRSLELQDIYLTIEQLFKEQGWEGEECLLRTICEFAKTPLVRNQDIIEDIIHLLLTPSEDLVEIGYLEHRSIGQLYLEAERLGGNGNDCILTYPDCIESPLKSFTQIISP